MEQLNRILRDIWRETGRHGHLPAVATAIHEVVNTYLPVARIVVRRIDLNHSSVETLAQAPVSMPPADTERSICGSPEIEALAKWCEGRQVVTQPRSAVARAPYNLVIPQTCQEEVIAGPLRSPGGIFGVLIVEARPGSAFRLEHRDLLGMLLEPFGVALDNDHRLQELALLREAAEAERQTLLRKLGKPERGEAIIGGESGLRLVMERVELVSRSDVPVLILGETGTGKEVIARAIHQRSNRANGPVLRVNCGAIPPELLDAQLFGHERGAFTGAVETTPGWFERAHGGTLFLDEIGELSPAAQVRLLRVLQDGSLERIGGTKTLHVDVRVVAATHRDLPAMIAENRFREDLWYRLAVFPILLPPLRDRKHDIPALARHFAERAAVRFGLAPQQPGADDLELLQRYSWPGNIRELGSVIDRAAILGDGRGLHIAQALGLLEAPSRLLAPEAGSAPVAVTDRPLAHLDTVIRQHIEAALLRTKGRIDGPFGAALLLGLNPHTLRGKMRKLRIDWRAFRAGQAVPTGTER